MAQTSSKRARPAFSPPRPKASASASKVSKSKDAARKPQGRRSVTAGQKKRKGRAVSHSPTASEDGGASDSAPQSESSSSEPARSPEPDFMLAEVTHEPESEPAIPLPLLQRILHHHYTNKEKTKISKDAREILGKYVEVFAREAIMRASYESNERAGGAGGADDSGIGGNEAGMSVREHDWLEVEDLEKVSAQMCLDF